MMTKLARLGVLVEAFLGEVTVCSRAARISACAPKADPACSQQ
jgi:hypothetical protein